jgi:uncharacterized protein
LTAYFIDTSALAKRYLNELGSHWLLSWILPTSGNVIVVSELVYAEMFSLLARRQRERGISVSARDVLQAQFMLDMGEEYLLVPLDLPVFTISQRLLNTYPLRALDAIQLASAIHASQILRVPLIFISADRNLLNAASAEGFTIDDPNAHPDISLTSS